jgi:hypothetical protein
MASCALRRRSVTCRHCRFQRGQIGLRSLDVDQPVDERHAVGIAFCRQPRTQIAVAAGDRGLAVGIGGRAGDLRQFLARLRPSASASSRSACARLARIGLLDVRAPVVERDQVGFRLGHLGSALRRSFSDLPVLAHSAGCGPAPAACGRSRHRPRAARCAVFCAW